MRQRLDIDSLSNPITSQFIEAAKENAQRDISKLKALPSTWLGFCEHKLHLASESLGFLLKQRVQLNKRGFPNIEIDYLQLIEERISKIKHVYLSFYRLAPGLIHKLGLKEPELYMWLMLQKEFGSDVENLVRGLIMLDDLDPDTALFFTTHSTAEYLDSSLAALIEGREKNSELYLECLRVRQSLSHRLTIKWLKAGLIKPQVAYPILALQNVKEGIDWIDKNARSEEYLFERLLTKRDGRAWFYQKFCIEKALSPNVITYAQLLELTEFDEFDVESPSAEVHFVLSGDWQRVPEIIRYIERLDELEGEIWIQALYVVYGEQLPLDLERLYVEYEWDEVKARLKSWVDEKKHVLDEKGRLGKTLSFESTLEAMKDTSIDAKLRIWLWKQLCVRSCVYVPWDLAMSAEQQENNFNRLKSSPHVRHRFNLRNSNAVVGY